MDRGNQLTGEIPAELGNLSSLERLYLNDNQLTGEIPPELGDFARLSFLSLHGNDLTGCVPTHPPGLEVIERLKLDLPDCPGVVRRRGLGDGLDLSLRRPAGTLPPVGVATSASRRACWCHLLGWLA